MFYLETKDVGWWYWVVIVLFLTCGMAADPLGYRLAIGMTTISAIHCWLWKGGVSAFPVQVRLCYLALLLLCWLEPIRWLYWVPLVGGWASILFGYCAMARIVSLFPWNRSESLSISLLATTFLSRPVRGSVMQRFAEHARRQALLFQQAHRALKSTKPRFYECLRAASYCGFNQSTQHTTISA